MRTHEERLRYTQTMGDEASYQLLQLHSTEQLLQAVSRND